MSLAWIRFRFLCGSNLHSAWIRKLAHGREVYVVPLDTIGMTVFVAELSHHLKSRNIDIDRLSAYRSRQAGTNLPTKEATQALARDLAQHLQSLLPSYQTPDTSSQQRVLELEAEIAKMKGNTQSAEKEDKSASTTTTASGTMPIREALHGRTPTTPAFDPASLLPTRNGSKPTVDSNPDGNFEQKH